MLRYVLAAIALSTPLGAQESILVQSTTSTANSGLYDHILPRFEAEAGIRVNVVAVGTGQAIRNASNCDGDVLVVHSRAAEEAFIAQGFGIERFDLMFNDFIIIGPVDDPAGIASAPTATAALALIAQTPAIFASRGDDSGTHAKEVALWSGTDVDREAASGTWYRETGSGMGATLNAAIGMDAYALTDRATWTAFGNKGDHAILFEGDPDLRNQYGVIAIDPAHCPEVKADAAQTFVDWLLSETGQAAIASHIVAGQQLFFPNAAR